MTKNKGVRGQAGQVSGRTRGLEYMSARGQEGYRTRGLEDKRAREQKG